mgnify:CR=1 FL=1
MLDQEPGDDLSEEFVDEWLELDRWVNSGSPSGFSAVHVTSESTLPTSPHRTFSLPIFDLRSTQVAYTHFGDRARCLSPWEFPVHPDMSERFEEATKLSPVRSIPASATSSMRTVFVEGRKGQAFLKLSYHDLLGRQVRLMTQDHVRSAVQVSRVLRRAILGHNVTASFGIFHEPFGVALDGDALGLGWGYVERQFAPIMPQVDGQLIPAFSLFGNDRRRAKNTPLLHAIIGARKQLLRPDLFFNLVLRPVLDSYFGVLVKTGLQLELHAQNLVFLVPNSPRRSWRVVYRDMESVDKDLPLMRIAGTAAPFINDVYKALREEDYNYQIKHSFMFDFKLGEYVLRPLVDCWEKASSANVAELIRLIRRRVSHWQQVLPESFLPAGWYDYAPVIHVGERRDYQFHAVPPFREGGHV